MSNMIRKYRPGFSYWSGNLCTELFESKWNRVRWQADKESQRDTG